MLVSIRKASEVTGLSPNTLRKYADNGTIKAYRRTPTSKRRFQLEELEQLMHGGAEEQRKPVVCYCRVSSRKQARDLARQVAYMRQNFPDADIVTDVGSGLNFKRQGLWTILQRLMQGDKLTLIVAHRDRLCRFGFDLIERLVQNNGGEVMVLDNDEVSPQRELTEDLLAILHAFSCRMHGLRRYASQIKEDTHLSDTAAEAAV